MEETRDINLNLNATKNMQSRRLPAITWVIFTVFFIVRTAFVLFSGYDSFELQPDTERYDRQSDAILEGKFNLTERLFIIAPAYSYLEAIFKFVFGSSWIPALQIFQITLSSLSGVALYKMAGILWGRVDIALIASTLYCFFPLTLWWVHTFSQETLFQCLLIFSMYYFIKAISTNNIGLLALSAVLFSAAYLTKSHILLFSVFIPVIILLSENKTFKQKIAYALVFA